MVDCSKITKSLFIDKKNTVSATECKSVQSPYSALRSDLAYDI